jgi:hypothetical protein
MSAKIPDHVEALFWLLRGRHQVGLEVDWKVSPDMDQLMIYGFCRFGGKAGNGKIAMEQLCCLADSYGLKLMLQPDNKRLQEYYETFGFKVGKSDYHGGRPDMIRQPDTKNAEWHPDFLPSPREYWIKAHARREAEQRV